MSDPGIREFIYLEGVTLARGPASVQIGSQVAETRQRFRDGGLRVHRLADPYAGANERIIKHVFSLSWPTLTTADIAALNGLIAWGGPIDFCCWVPIVESFWLANSVAFSGTLARREALDYVTPLPVDAATRYVTSATKGGVAYAVTLGTVANDRTPWTGAGTSSGERVLISYTPVYSVVVGESQPLFTAPHVQGQTLQLEEV